MSDLLDRSPVSIKPDIVNSQLEWLEDSTMVSEIEKLSDELRNRDLSLENETVDSLVSSTKPLVASDYRSEIKDGVKEFEIDGQKFLRKYQRKIQLEKHTVKQLFTFSGEDGAILDVDIVPEPRESASPHLQLPLTTSNLLDLGDHPDDVFFNINTQTLSEETRSMLSPRIVIRSMRNTPTTPSQGHQLPSNQNPLSGSEQKVPNNKKSVSSVKENDTSGNPDSVTTSDVNSTEFSSFTAKFGGGDDSRSNSNSRGRTELTEMLVMDQRLSRELRHSFLAQWQKSETASSSGSSTIGQDNTLSRAGAKSKTISCVERFSRITDRGQVLHGSTCVQLTRSLVIRPPSLDEANKEFEKTKEVPLTPEESLLFKVDVSSNLIYNEKYDPFSENACKHMSISAGQLDAIIAHACSIGLNTTQDYHLFHKVFAVTYSLFVSTLELIKKLISRYRYFSAAPRTNDANKSNGIVWGDGSESILSQSCDNIDSIREELLTAVINVLIETVNHWSRPMTADVSNSLCSFADELSTDLRDLGSVRRAELIREAIDQMHCRVRKREHATQTRRPMSVLEHQGQSRDPATIPRGTKKTSSVKSVSKTILDFDSRVVAEQITMLESEIFDQIQLEDLLNFKSATSNINLMNCVHFFNSLTYWVKTQLFTDSDRGSIEREKRFCKFIEILKILKSHQNFSSYTSILYSLIDFPDKVLSKRTKQHLTEESDFMSLSNKRQYLEAVQLAEPPFIPLLADIFSHLTRLNEIMPSFVKAASPSSSGAVMEMVNFKKMWNYFIVIQFFIRKMQLPQEKRSYSFKLDAPVLQFLNDFKDRYTETQLFQCRENLIRSKSRKTTSSSVSSRHQCSHSNASSPASNSQPPPLTGPNTARTLEYF